MTTSMVSSSLDAPTTPCPSLFELFTTWLRIGATSFGGGSATQLLIQQQFVTRRQWMTPGAFAQDWAIVQFAPGINLIAMTVLIGHRFGGMLGVAVSLLGMLGPAIAITIAMTALYSQVRDWPQVQGALRGITPALVGLSIAFMWRLLKEPLAGLKRRGRRGPVAGLILLAVATALTALGVPVLFAYLAGAAGLGIFYAVTSHLPKEEPWTG
jgi:chromate transporter